MTNKQSRKDFLKKIGLTLASAAVTPSVLASESDILNDTELDEEQKEFLVTYEKWLTEFHGFVKTQKADIASTENNLKLMKLSAQAEEWKRQLEVHMMDERFATHHRQITENITQDIA